MTELLGRSAGPINNLAEVFADPQVIARGMRIDLPHPAAKGGAIPGVRSPITINGRRAASDRAQPQVGEHTAEILHEIGEA
jgi:crotonobetainyl-CoA:carnitine CoA-transferase CaiB-like acyl-CoA transferase